MGDVNAGDIKQKSLLRKVFVGLRNMFIFFIFLILVILLILQTKWAQNYARKETVSYLEKKLETKVVIRDLSITFPSMIVLEGLYVQDQKKDTLLAGRTLAVDINIFRLLKSDMFICEVKTSGLIVNINRQMPDSLFNYQFIIDAFSSKTPKVEEKTPMKMAIEHLVLNDTHFTFMDEIMGNEAVVSIVHFETDIDTFDPAKLNFDVPKIKINGIKGHFNQTSALEVITTTKSTDPNTARPKTNFLKFTNQLTSIQNIEFEYSNNVSGIQTSFKGKSLDIFPENLDLASNLMAFRKIELIDLNSKVVIQSKNSSDLIKLISSDGQEIMNEYLPWKVKVDVIHFHDSHLDFDDNTKPVISPGMDYGHLSISKLNLEADHFYINKDTIAANITSGSLKDKSGFVVHSLNTDFQFTDKGIRASNLHMKTPGSDVKRSMVVRYPSLNAIVNDKSLIDLDLTLDNSIIQIKDILYFAPYLAGKPGFTDPESTFDIHGRLTGSLKKLYFPSMQVKAFGNTNADFSGTLTNVTDLGQVGMDLDIRSLSTTAHDIRVLLPKGSLPKNIIIPDKLSLEGIAKGNMANLFADLKLKTSLGSATLKGTIKNINKPSVIAYDCFITLDGLQLGKLIPQPDSLGTITAQFNIKGTAIDPKTAKANIDGLIRSFVYKGYVYKNVNLDIQVDRMSFLANGDIKDPNIHLSFEAEGDLLAAKPCINFNAYIDSIKTMPLHLTSKPFVYRGDIECYIPEFDPDSLAGYVFITNSLMMANDKRIKLDSISMIASYKNYIQSITISSDFVQASILGKYKATQLGNIFLNALNPYYAIGPDTITYITDAYDFTFTATISDHPTIRALLPELNRMEQITMKGDFSDVDGWKAELKVPYLAYGNNIVSNLNVLADEEDDVLNLVADVGNITSGDNIIISGTRLNAKITSHKVDFALRIGDKEKKDKYIVHGGLLRHKDSNFSLALRQDSLILNYQPWEIDKDNLISFSPSMVQVNHFDLSKENQHLIIQNIESGPNSPLEILFKDFKLATLTGFFQTDSILVDGTLGGKILVRDIATQPNFTTDLSIINLAVKRDTIGDIHAVIDNTQSNIFAIDIALSGRGNDVSLFGNYYLKPESKSKIDLALKIKTLQMRSLEGASLGNIKNSEGHVSGKVIIKGNMTSPDIKGNLEFFETSMMITKLNSVFKVDKEQILAIDNEGFRFNDFNIRDAGGNRFNINGNAFTKNYFNYVFDLSLKANNFQAINSTRADNQAYYGKIVFDMEMQVSGTEKAPVIDGRLKINEGTEFTIVLPQKEPGLVARKGVVVFVDKDIPVNEKLFLGVLDSLNQSSILGMYVSVNIEIDKKAELTIVIDESTNDLLKLKGQALLNGGIDKSGKVTLTGTYELDEGAYEMSFNLLERRFDIQKGSKITWKGEPTDGNLNITAVYKVNTTVAELVQDQVVEAKTDLRYRQKLSFEVLLSMSGPLLQPILAFEIKLPKESLVSVGGEIAGQVEMRLLQLNAEPSELNKQVFSLLILNRFTSQNPFESAGGGINAESMARQSVSKILTSQLNKLAEDLITGVDINFDIVSSEDYTTGTLQNKTDLNVGVSKRLFNERLNVSLGTNIALEGGKPNNSLGSLAASNAPNVNIEYLLSKDGRYLLRAYRRNKYEGIVEGYIIETGIGFVMSVDYDRFMEIFEREKSNNIFKKETKATETPIKKPETPPSNEPEIKQIQGILNERKDDDEN